MQLYLLPSSLSKSQGADFGASRNRRTPAGRAFRAAEKRQEAARLKLFDGKKNAMFHMFVYIPLPSNVSLILCHLPLSNNSCSDQHLLITRFLGILLMGTFVMNQIFMYHFNAFCANIRLFIMTSHRRTQPPFFQHLTEL